MRVALRADAGIAQGTGHVMRCLTLAEELGRRGHDCHLVTSDLTVGWLDAMVGASGVTVHTTAADALSAEVLDLEADWIVVDSYRISADQISFVNESCRVLAIIDGDHRGIKSTLYLDHNLNAEKIVRPTYVASRIMAGADFALIRDAVLDSRRPEPWRFASLTPTIVGFMGGTDPTGACLEMAAGLAAATSESDLVIIAPVEQHKAIGEILAGRKSVTLLAPTPHLPALFARADIIVSAAGTSAWEICTLGVPAVLVAVVENQAPSLEASVARGLTLGVNSINRTSDLADRLAPLVRNLIADEGQRRVLSMSSLAAFDGGGKSRVADHMERAPSLPHPASVR